MSSAIFDRPLRIAAHVRACEIGGQVILLDLRAGRYMGVPHAASAEFVSRVDGWPKSATKRSEDLEVPPSAEHRGIADRLVAQGLLVHALTEFESAPSSTPGIDDAMSSLDLADIASHQTLGARRFARFLRNAGRAAWWLRRRSLHWIALTLQARRERRPDPNAVDLQRMKLSAATYERLRPLLLSAHEKCLFDSLAMMGFLASENLFPRWVIGVRIGPFGAHSWVQTGATVLNDQHEYVRQFRPILVV